MKPAPDKAKEAKDGAANPQDPFEAPIEPVPSNESLLQEKWRAAYLEQLKRRACPGCGEDEFLE